MLLTESDIPGLGSKSVDELSINELKHWLVGQGARRDGEKTNFRNSK